MRINVTIDVMLAKRKMSSKALAEIVGLSETQMSHYRCGNIRTIRFDTLSRLCKALDCNVGDLIQFISE